MREIAVIDAESRIRETVVECFGHLCCEVKCANNATQGAKLLASRAFDLALIDAQLFGESGIDLF